jgi:hypothetical protein
MNDAGYFRPPWGLKVSRVFSVGGRERATVSRDVDNSKKLSADPVEFRDRFRVQGQRRGGDVLPQVRHR